MPPAINPKGNPLPGHSSLILPKEREISCHVAGLGIVFATYSVYVIVNLLSISLRKMFLADKRTLSYSIILSYSLAQIISFCLCLSSANPSKQRGDITIMTRKFLSQH